MYLSRFRRAILLLLIVTSNCTSRAAQQGVSRVDEAKARFLIKSAEFVDWPAEVFKTPASTLLICVYGNYPFGISLAEMAQGSLVRGHRMAAKWIRKEQDLPSCQILFVSRSEAKHYGKVLETVKNAVTLTIGEDPDFLKAGGMVSLEAAPDSLLFDVNLDAVRSGQLRLSSQLLSLARRIIQRSEAARS